MSCLNLETGCILMQNISSNAHAPENFFDWSARRFLEGEEPRTPGASIHHKPVSSKRRAAPTLGPFFPNQLRFTSGEE